MCILKVECPSEGITIYSPHGHNLEMYISLFQCHFIEIVQVNCAGYSGASAHIDKQSTATG